MYLLPFNHPDFPPTDNGWKFFVNCDDDKGEVSSFLDAVDQVGPALFDDIWVYASKLAQLGTQWKRLIPDAVRLHDVGKVSLRHESGNHFTETVWEFKHGRIRILWCYAGDNKAILFGHTLLKTKGKITKADLHPVEVAMQSYITAVESGNLKIVGESDNEQAH